MKNTEFRAVPVNELLKENILDNKENLTDVYNFYRIIKGTIKDITIREKLDSINSYLNKAIEKLTELEKILNKI